MRIPPIFSHNGGRLSYALISLVILLIHYHVRAGLEILNPTFINWVIDHSELSNGFFSFGFFRHEPWVFPLGVINNYFYPIGTNVYLCDIPLLALPFKLFSPVLPENFQYIGIWYLTCHLLQAWFGLLLCERLSINGYNKVVTVIFLLFTPVLLSRSVHPALFCHWMILAAIWIYLLDPVKTSVRRILLYQSLLLVCSGLVFAYMWTMMLGFSCALLLRLWLVDKKIGLLGTAITLVLQLTTMWALWSVTGLFTSVSASNYAADGWGSLSMNINSPFNPMNTGKLLPVLPYFVDQQLEGYNYFGAGFLLVSVVCIVSIIVSRTKSQPLPSLRSMSGTALWPLLLFLALCAFFSLSNRISFNKAVVFEYPLPDSIEALARSFRASGRYFWPVYYFVFISVLYFIGKARMGPLLKGPILSVCLLVQLYDLQYFLKPVDVTYSKEYVPPLNPVWDQLIAYHKVIFFQPGFRRSFRSFDDYRYFTYYAVVHRKKINMGYMARFDPVSASAAMREESLNISELGLNEDYLYISTESHMNRLVLALADGEAYCYDIDGYLVLFRKTSASERIAKIIEAQGGVDQTDKLGSRLLLTPWTNEPDSVTKNAKLSFYETDESDGHLFLKGWAFSTSSEFPGTDSIQLVLESSDGERWISPAAYRFGTPDVAGFFNNPALVESGFGISILNKNLTNGVYRIGFLFTTSESVKKLFWTDGPLIVNRPAEPVITELPTKRGELTFDVNRIVDTTATVFIDSWAFPNNAICPGCRPYYILQSPQGTYMLEATAYHRDDVASLFKNPALINTGQSVRFKKKQLDAGNYDLTILLRDTVNDFSYYSTTGKVVKIREEFAEPTLVRNLPTRADSIESNIDKVGDYRLWWELEGWAFVQRKPTTSTKTFLVLKSERRSFLFQTNMVDRPDVQLYYNPGVDVSTAGFRLKIRKNAVEPGEYEICIMIEESTSAMQRMYCTGTTIAF